MNEQLSPEANLVLLVVYEQQHLAGKSSVSRAEVERICSDELSEHGTVEAAVAAVKKRIRGSFRRQQPFSENA